MIKARSRVVGFYPISIATSLAMESALNTGEHEDLLRKERPLRNKLLMINIRTLYRNAFNSFSAMEKKLLTIKPILDAVAEDIGSVFEAVKRSEPDCEVVFYYCTYKNVEKHMGDLNYYNRGDPTAKNNIKVTNGQLLYRQLEKDLFLNLLDETDNMPEDIVVKEYEFEITTKKPTVLLTHYPSDLLSAPNMPSCVLLESHTGKFKGDVDWPSKLHNKPKNMPFSKMTLSAFGDGVMIAPQELQARKLLLEYAAKYKWDHRTSDTRIIEVCKSKGQTDLVKLLRKWK